LFPAKKKLSFVSYILEVNT